MTTPVSAWSSTLQLLAVSEAQVSDEGKHLQYDLYNPESFNRPSQGNSDCGVLDTFLPQNSLVGNGTDVYLEGQKVANVLHNANSCLFALSVEDFEEAGGKRVP